MWVIVWVQGKQMWNDLWKGDRSESAMKITSYIFDNTLIRFYGLNYPYNPLFLNIMTQT